MSQRISVRRAKVEDSRAQRQAIWALVITILLGIFFLLVVMPVAFRVALSLARSGETGPILNSDTLPPQRPQFTPPAPYQNTSELQITGYTEAKATVTLILNGETAGTTTADDDGQFTWQTSLEEGPYVLTALATDEAGNDSETTSEFSILVDKTAPTVNVTAPSPGQVFTLRREQTITIAGQASEEGLVFVNGSRVSTDSEGNFSTPRQLGEGDNTLTIVAEDRAGNRSAETSITVRYLP